MVTSTTFISIKTIIPDSKSANFCSRKHVETRKLPNRLRRSDFLSYAASQDSHSTNRDLIESLFSENGEVDTEKLGSVLSKVEANPSRTQLSKIVTGLAESLVDKRIQEPHTDLPTRKPPTRRPPTIAVSRVTPWQEYAEIDALERQSEKKMEESTENAERRKFLEFRKRLNIKLSQANSSNRHLKRQLQSREKEIVDMRVKLKSVEDKLKDLSLVAKEVAQAPASATTAKFRGKFVFSYISNSIDEIHEDVKVQVANVEAMAVKEVNIEWHGVAEDVKIMGSFDDWTTGEQLSPEITGVYTRFSTTLYLRPGTYEVKFLVDGKWRVIADWPQVGSGLTANNQIVVQ